MTWCVSNHTPYDDDPDVVEEAEKFLKQHQEGQLSLIDKRDINWAAKIIEYLLDELDEAGL